MLEIRSCQSFAFWVLESAEEGDEPEGMKKERYVEELEALNVEEAVLNRKRNEASAKKKVEALRRPKRRETSSIEDGQSEDSKKEGESIEEEQSEGEIAHDSYREADKKAPKYDEKAENAKRNKNEEMEGKEEKKQSALTKRDTNKGDSSNKDFEAGESSRSEEAPQVVADIIQGKEGCRRRGKEIIGFEEEQRGSYFLSITSLGIFFRCDVDASLLAFRSSGLDKKEPPGHSDHPAKGVDG